MADQDSKGHGFGSEPDNDQPFPAIKSVPTPMTYQSQTISTDTEATSPPQSPNLSFPPSRPSALLPALAQLFKGRKRTSSGSVRPTVGEEESNESIPSSPDDASNRKDTDTQIAIACIRSFQFNNSSRSLSILTSDTSRPPSPAQSTFSMTKIRDEKRRKARKSHGHRRHRSQLEWKDESKFDLPQIR